MTSASSAIPAATRKPELAVFDNHGPVTQEGLALVTGGQPPGLLDRSRLDERRSRPGRLTPGHLLRGPGRRQGAFGHHSLRVALSIHDYQQRRPRLAQAGQSLPGRFIPARLDRGLRTPVRRTGGTRPRSIGIHATIIRFHIQGGQPGGAPRRGATPADQGRFAPVNTRRVPDRVAGQVSHGHLRPARDIADVDRST